MCHDLLVRAGKPIEQALKLANITLEELDAVELIGGAMRVPKVQEAISHVLGDGKLELGMHLNSDESMALGAAFHGANVSTSFKVRHVGMADVNTFPIAVDMTDLEVGKEEKKSGGGLFGIGKKKSEDAKKKSNDDDAWAKHATIFKLGSKLGVKKTIAFSYDKDVHVEINYEESDTLPIGTGLSIEQYDVSGIAEFAKEMAAKELGTPKVSLQFELDTSGLTRLVKAEAVVEETVMVDEEIEVDDDDDEDDKASQENATKDGDEKEKVEDSKADDKKVDADEKADEEPVAKEGETKNDTAEGDDKKAAEKVDKKKKKKKTKTVQKVCW
jgi:hypoxia up-regulated 1